MGFIMNDAEFNEFISIVLEKSFEDSSYRNTELHYFVSRFPKDYVASMLINFLVDSERIFKPFSEDEIAASLEFIFSPGSSDLVFFVVGDSIEMRTTFLFVDSIVELYKGYLSSRLGSFLLKNDSALSYFFYSVWDVIPIRQVYSESSRQKIVDDYVIDALEKILSIGNVACVESALHGLGHWYYTNPLKVKRIIKKHLSHLPKPLVEYAKKAMSGDVL